MSQSTTDSHPFSPGTQRVLLVATLILFGGLTAVAVATDGVNGTIEAITFNWASLQIYVDLVIAVAVISVWLYGDARRRGKNPWPWIIAAFIIGMFSPLVYLLTRANNRTP